MTLCARDRELCTIWERHGVPDDLSTQQARDDMCLRLWAGYRELETALAVAELLVMGAPNGH